MILLLLGSANGFVISSSAAAPGFSWGTIKARGYTWAVMAGDMFLSTSTTPTTIWTATPIPVEQCGV